MNKTKQIIIKARRTKEAPKRLRSNPPWLIGLSKKSPRTAPNGLVKTKADQNKNVLEIFVQKYRMVSNSNKPPKIKAALVY